MLPLLVLLLVTVVHGADYDSRLVIAGPECPKGTLLWQFSRIYGLFGLLTLLYCDVNVENSSLQMVIQLVSGYQHN